MKVDRRRFLGATALGGGAVLASALPGGASTGTGVDTPDIQTRPGSPSMSDETARRDQPRSSGGLSRARLARMHRVMAGYVERGAVPGLVTLVSRRGEVHVDVIGMTAVGGRDPMRRDTIFRIASLTKSITAVATMILVEECKLRLDEPVDRLLPELANRKVFEATRRAARRHRAGEAADHRARPADLPHGLGLRPGAAVRLSDAEGIE